MIQIQKDVSLAMYSSFHIGGKASHFVEIKTTEDALEAWQFGQTQKLPIFFLGGGSNVLFPDQGLEALIIKNSINFIEKLPNDQVHVGAGTYTTALAQFCADNELSGIEKLFALPGTFGGAIVGNAGTLGTEIKDVLLSATLINPQGEIITAPASTLDFQYRESNLKRTHQLVLSGIIQLKPGQKDTIKQVMTDTKNWRRDHQPGGFSGGSFFKNPEGYSAGQLIEQAGLKGYTIGGAQVSPKHANFLTNTGKATSKDVMLLAAHIKEVVKSQFGIELVEEIRPIQVWVPIALLLTSTLMSTNFHSKIHLSNDTKEYIEKKLQSLSKYYVGADADGVHTVVDVDHNHEKNNTGISMEARITVGKKVFIATERSTTVEEGIDLIHDKLKTQLQRHKEKQQENHE